MDAGAGGAGQGDARGRLPPQQARGPGRAAGGGGPDPTESATDALHRAVCFAQPGAGAVERAAVPEARGTARRSKDKKTSRARCTRPGGHCRGPRVSNWVDRGGRIRGAMAVVSNLDAIRDGAEPFADPDPSSDTGSSRDIPRTWHLRTPAGAPRAPKPHLRDLLAPDRRYNEK